MLSLFQKFSEISSVLIFYFIVNYVYVSVSVYLYVHIGFPMETSRYLVLFELDWVLGTKYRSSSRKVLVLCTPSRDWTPD